MRIDILLINIIFAMLSGFLLIIYLKSNNIIYKKDREVIFIALFGLINGLLSTRTSSLGDIANIIKPFVLIFSSVLVIKLMLDLKLVRSIVVFVYLMIGMGIGNAIGLLIMGPFVKGYVAGEIGSNPALYVLGNVICAVITVLFLLVLKPANYIFKQIISSKELAVTLAFTFVIISASAGLYYYVKLFNFAAFLSITIMTFVVSGYALFNGTILFKRMREKIEKDQQKFYNDSLENSLFNLRRFKHDWSNNLTVLKSMIANSRFEDAEKYLDEIIDINISSNDTTVYNIKNAGLFGIISSKQAQAKEAGLNLEIKGIGEINTIPGIKVSELCEVLGIFLDNAIEESEFIKSNIELNYLVSENTIEVSIKNTCRTDIDISLIGTSSTKGPGRGNGLQIVESIIKKYRNIKNFRSYEPEDKVFEQLLIIEKG